jgi:Carboxypeptidase regulatory-like domain
MSPRLFLAATGLLAGSLLAADSESFCIAGQVVNGTTGEPLRGAAVTIPQSASLTDAAGTFRFCSLAPGAYYAHAEKPGFAAAGILVPVGPSKEDVILRLQPLGVIHGTVLDGDNHPLENATIQVLSTATEAGRRKVRVEQTVATDDRGQYRLANLRPGHYYIRAAGWQGSPQAKAGDAHQTFAPVYYGGSSDVASATPQTVDAGGDVTADFTVTLEPAYAIRGHITGFSSLVELNVELLGAADGLSTAPITFDPLTGVFQASNVAPGSYLVRATQGEGDQRTRGEQDVEVSASDVNDVMVTMAGPETLKGVVRTASSSGNVSGPPDCSLELSPAGLVVSGETLQTSTGDMGLKGLMAATGLAPGESESAPSANSASNQESHEEFELPGVLPGRYRIRMDCTGGYVASARAGSSDLMAHDELTISPGAPPPEVEIVVSTDGGTVDVTAPKDQEGVSAWLVLLPDSGSEMHTRFTILRGKISLSGVAPGDYHAYAWTGSPYAFDYAEPGARQMWANRAVSVHVSERERVSVTAKIAPGETQ